MVSKLLANNYHWATRLKKKDPQYFNKLSEQQSPEYLWVGCSDSRVPANQIVDMYPGQIFVHRNVANLVVHTDFNFLSVLQYAVEVLKVKHVIVCGHYGCGGVNAALRGDKYGLIDNWLQNIRNVYLREQARFEGLTEAQQLALLCELNVIEQAKNVSQTTVVQGAWEKEQPLSVHGWIYGLEDGLIRDLGVSVGTADEGPKQSGA